MMQTSDLKKIETVDEFFISIPKKTGNSSTMVIVG